MRVLLLLGLLVAWTPSAALAQDPTQPAPPPAPEAAAGVDAWAGMDAGGLAPPPPDTATTAEGAPAPVVPDPTSSGVDEDLDESKERDSGRGTSWFWIEVLGGYEHVGLQTFNVDEENFAVGLVETESNGGAISAGLGAQLVVFTIGARARLSFFEDWQIGRIGGEIGFRIPIGFVEPRFDLGAGYAALGNFNGVVPEAISIRGFYARAGAGVDFYPVKILAIGAHASFDFMGLTRPGLDPAEIRALEEDPDVGDLDAAAEQALALEGSGYGASFALQGVIGLHF